MSATIRAISLESWAAKPAAEPREGTAGAQGVPKAPRTPALRGGSLLRPAPPRRFGRLPPPAPGVPTEQRQHPRATLKLPLRLRAVGGVPEEYPITLVTRDISSTGVYFLCPKHLAVGTPIELEVVLMSKPMGLGNVVMVTLA